MSPDRPASRRARCLRWLQRRKLELGVVALGILLRLSMTWNYGYRWGYDADSHWDVVQWIVKHGVVPYASATIESFHPPLWYVLTAWFVNHGLTRPTAIWISIVSGALRLGVIWAFLELFVPRSRTARLSGLALAAVTSISIQVDGMIYPEALNGLLAALALLLLGLGARRADGRRWPLAIALGVVTGLAVLTKASGVVLVVSIASVAALELVVVDRPWRVRLQRVLPWMGAIVIAISVCGWYSARNVREYDKPFVTSFETSQSFFVDKSNKLALLDRRTLGYLLGWDRGLYLFPFGIYAVGSHPRFFSVTVASTFVDFYDHHFEGFDSILGHDPHAGPGDRRPYMFPAVLAMIGGTLIFAATVVAWFAVTWRAARDRNVPMLALMLVPAIGTLAALLFSTTYPVDNVGVIKGAYLLYVAPPLCALFGMSVSWARRQWHRWPVLGILVVALYFVATYSLECRLHFPVVPRV